MGTAHCEQPQCHKNHGKFRVSGVCSIILPAGIAVRLNGDQKVGSLTLLISTILIAQGRIQFAPACEYTNVKGEDWHETNNERKIAWRY